MTYRGSSNLVIGVVFIENGDEVVQLHDHLREVVACRGDEGSRHQGPSSRERSCCASLSPRAKRSPNRRSSSPVASRISRRSRSSRRIEGTRVG